MGNVVKGGWDKRAVFKVVEKWENLEKFKLAPT